MKRSHKNTRRLTARERAQSVAASIFRSWLAADVEIDNAAAIIQRALQAHARAALRRDQRRDGK